MGDNTVVSSTDVDSSANVVIRNCSIHNFDVDVSWEGQTNSYLQKFENDQFGACNWCLYADTDITGTTTTAINVGENIRFSQCVFYACENVAYANNGYNFNFDQCSFDYFYYYGLEAAAGCTFNLSQCHIETSYQGDIWLKADSTSFAHPSMITLSQGILLDTATGNQFNFLMKTGTGNAYNAITMEQSNVVIGSTYNSQTIGTGKVFVRRPANGGFPATAFAGSIADNWLADGGFEVSGTTGTLTEWAVSGTGVTIDGTTSVTGTNTPFPTGSHSVKFAGTTASSITYSGTIPPGVVPTISFFIRSNNASTSGTTNMVAYAYLTNPANPNLQALTEGAYNYTAPAGNQDWTPVTYRGLSGWTPTGGVLKVIFASEFDSTNQATYWIDNVIVETQ